MNKENDDNATVKKMLRALQIPTVPLEKVELAIATIKRLIELAPDHIAPYNLGDDGEINSQLQTLHQLFSNYLTTTPAPQAKFEWQIKIAEITGTILGLRKVITDYDGTAKGKSIGEDLSKVADELTELLNDIKIEAKKGYSVEDMEQSMRYGYTLAANGVKFYEALPDFKTWLCQLKK